MPLTLCQVSMISSSVRLRSLLKSDLPRGHFFRKVLKVGDLLTESPHAPQFFGSEPQQRRGSEPRADSGFQFGENAGGGFPADLLVDDRTNQRFESRLTGNESIRSDGRNDTGKNRIGFLQMQNGGAHGLKPSG